MGRIEVCVGPSVEGGEGMVGMLELSGVEICTRGGLKPGEIRRGKRGDGGDEVLRWVWKEWRLERGVEVCSGGRRGRKIAKLLLAVVPSIEGLGASLLEMEMVVFEDP